MGCHRWRGSNFSRCHNKVSESECRMTMFPALEPWKSAKLHNKGSKKSEIWSCYGYMSNWSNANFYPFTVGISRDLGDGRLGTRELGMQHDIRIIRDTPHLCKFPVASKDTIHSDLDRYNVDVHTLVVIFVALVCTSALSNSISSCSRSATWSESRFNSSMYLNKIEIHMSGIYYHKISNQLTFKLENTYLWTLCKRLLFAWLTFSEIYP